MEENDKQQKIEQEDVDTQTNGLVGCIVDVTSDTYKYFVEREEALIKEYGLDRKIDDNI